MKRAAGVLMHISSLPGEYSVGSFGDEAKYFIDIISDMGFSYWQVLPFGMPDKYNSPYKSCASMGASPFFIDLPELFRKGLITEGELLSAKQHSPYLCEYERLWDERLSLLRKAAKRVENKEEIKAYTEKYPELYEAAYFLAMKEKNGSGDWQKWKRKKPDADELFFWQFVQYEFFTEWAKIKEYANKKSIKIIGDLPIYVALDSADVYFNREDFLLDKRGNPTLVAGVPPDYFSEEGQLWGNPLYNYEKMRENGYALWRKRLDVSFRLFDGLRIDHFRGIESYWAIPEGKSAKEGSFIKGPGEELIDVIKEMAGDKLVIAEDLGDITDEVRALLKYSGFPGMRVMQFAFLGDKNSNHLPHNYTPDSIAYSGTHDNNTLLGYLFEETAEVRRRIFDYCGYAEDEINAGMPLVIKTILASVAKLSVFPIQDILGYGRDTRMNTPGRAEGNWKYRVTKEQLASIDRAKIRASLDLYGRI